MAEVLVAHSIKEKSVKAKTVMIMTIDIAKPNTTDNKVRVCGNFWLLWLNFHPRSPAQYVMQTIGDRRPRIVAVTMLTKINWLLTKPCF